MNKLRISERIPAEDLLGRIDCLLVGIARNWYKAYINEFTSWEKFESEFKRQFQKDSFEIDVRKKMQETMQNKDEPPSSYLLRMLCLANRLGEKLGEADKVSYVINGLNENISGPIRLFKPKSIRELTDLLLSYDTNRVTPITESAPAPKPRFPYNPQYQKSNVRYQFTKQLNELENHTPNNSNDNLVEVEDDDSEMSVFVDANEAESVKLNQIHDYKNRFSQNKFGSKISNNSSSKVFGV